MEGDCNVYALFSVNAPNPAWSIQYENGLYTNHFQETNPPRQKKK